MDTNLVNVLITALEKNRGGSEMSQIIVAGFILLAAVAPTLLGVLNYFQAKAAKMESGEAKLSAAATAKTVDEVHIAVNSEKTALLASLEALRLEVLSLSKDKAASNAHAQDRIKTEYPPLTKEQMDAIEKYLSEQIRKEEKHA